MSSTHPSGVLPIDADATSADWLRSLAVELHEAGRDGEWRPMLVGVVPPFAGRPHQLDLQTLTGADPVEQLLGLVAPDVWCAVGLLTGGRARLLDEPASGSPGEFVHLVDRHGVSVSTWHGVDGATIEIGGGPRPVEGRAADACRRMLRLPTAPPPGDTSSFVVDVWLGRVVEVARAGTHLTWDDVVALHPAAVRSCTPAEAARRTTALGSRLSWSDIRLGFVEGEIESFAGIDSCIAEWMDDGMLARWMLGSVPPWSSLLEIIDARLPPAVSDLVIATVGMCPPVPWPAP
ncbi:MAG TPA: hypothetical protein VIY72_17155 [Acidimicrobiales bacterium]